jgi:nucleotide-binding universal stress UspA family protein
MPVAFETLEKLCREVKKEYNVGCNYSIETTGNTLENSVGGKSDENTMIIMGTNGTEDLFQSVFGTNTYQVIRKSKSPVLMIPAAIDFKPIKKVVFAWDYNKDNKSSILKLQDLLKNFDFEIDFLHVSKEKTMIGDDVFKALKEEIHSYPGERNNITFHRIYSEDPELFPDKIDDYMNNSGADLLVITYYDRGVIKNIFHGTVARSLTEIAEYPLLILHVD